MSTPNDMTPEQAAEQLKGAWEAGIAAGASERLTFDTIRPRASGARRDDVSLPDRWAQVPVTFPDSLVDAPPEGR